MSCALSVDDAIDIIIAHAKRGDSDLRQYGYDIWLPSIWCRYVQEKYGLSPQNHLEASAQGIKLSSAFFQAGWELCRRGVLRPGVSTFEGQVTVEGQGGAGYSFTATGRAWLKNVDQALFVPLEPLRLAKLLARFEGRFGDGFEQRAQEAAKCYFATAWLACCAMCGAAAESILIATASEARSDPESVLREYQASGGRRRVESGLLGRIPRAEADRFKILLDLLSYWRDESAHGGASVISDVEAYDALSRLLRLAHFVDDRWPLFTKAS